MMGGGGGGFGSYDGWDDENLGAVYDRRIAIRLIPYIAQFKLWAAIAVVGMLAATFSSVAMPLFIGLTVDTAIATGNTARLAWMAGLFFVLVVINAIGLWLQSPLHGQGGRTRCWSTSARSSSATSKSNRLASMTSSRWGGSCPAS